MKYLFVVNPYAAKASAEQVKNLINSTIGNNKNYKDTEYEVIIPSTIVELENQIKNRLEKENISTIIAVGGDGTIAKVIQSIINYPKIRLGIIAQGTGNLLAANLGIPNSIEGSLETIFFGQESLIDLGKVNGKPFTIMAGTGLLTEIVEDIKLEDKALYGVWAYFLKGLERMYLTKESTFFINADGKEIKASGVGVFVANIGNFLAPCPTLMPEAQPTDGYLDLCILSLKNFKESPVDYVEILLNYVTRNLKSTDKMQTLKAKEILIDSSPKLRVQADGDVISETPMEIKILPKRLKVLVPNKAISFVPSISDLMEEIGEMFNISLNG